MPANTEASTLTAWMPLLLLNANVAQSDRAPDLYSGGCGFDSCHWLQEFQCLCRIETYCARLVSERRNPIGGLNPSTGSNGRVTAEPDTFESCSG